jgi:hypothetical protein
VLIKLTAKIGQAAIVGGLENDVSRNLDSIQGDEKVTAISGALEGRARSRPGYRSAACQRDRLQGAL